MTSRPDTYKAKLGLLLVLLIAQQLNISWASKHHQHDYNSLKLRRSLQQSNEQLSLLNRHQNQLFLPNQAPALSPLLQPSNFINQSISIASLTNKIKAQHLNHHQGQQREQVHYKTTYACEGNQLDLTCSNGKLIHLVRANYGRFSLSICNDLSDSNLSVQCASFRAFLIMEERCNKLSNCSVKVSTELFGDPCEGTSKYLEVQYLCDDASGNNHQAQLANSSSSLANPETIADSPSKSASVSGGGGTPSDNHKSPPNLSHHHHQQPQQSQTIRNLGSTVVGGFQPSTSYDQEQQNSRGNSEQATDDDVIPQGGPFCPAQASSRNLFWNSTRANAVARQGCPEGSVGKVSWYCDPEKLRFSPSFSPDFTQCKSIWLQRLAQKLDKLLEVPSLVQSYSPSDSFAKQQNEQSLREILNDLALMAKTKDLFSEDLGRIDIMISQIITHLKSLAAQSFFNQPASMRQTSLNQLLDDLFNKLVSIISSLFDVSQRGAWLDLTSNDVRKKLELRFLNHLKESGWMLINFNSLDSSLTIKQANLIAGIIVINNNQRQSLDSYETFNLQSASSRQSFNYNNRLFLSNNQLDNQPDSNNQAFQINANDEFKIHSTVINELAANYGISRYLVFDLKKPDYSMIRQQLESTYATLTPTTTTSLPGEGAFDQGQPANNLLADQQWTSRVFGLFPINGAGESNRFDFEGSNSKLFVLLNQWPITVDFKLSSQQQQQMPSRQCDSINSDQTALSRCQTLRSNLTNHICRCDSFGFLQLTTSSQYVLQPPNMVVPDFTQWPSQDQPDGFFANPTPHSYLNPPAKQGPTSVGAWATVFIVFGLSLLVISIVAFVISLVLKTRAQSRIAKKHANFLSTTGPLAVDHSLMIGGDSGNSPQNSSNSVGTTHSASIVGLSQATICAGSNGSANNYKSTNHQLYASHLPPIDSNYLASKSILPVWLSNWFKSTRWLSTTTASRFGVGNKTKNDMNGIQHSIIGPNANGGSMTYQNGYTTNIHHHHLHHQLQQANSRMPLTLSHQPPSSSTSSYVSSSAYYEEIGPGNLTKVNANQLVSNRALTMVDPFRRPAQDQQHLLTSNGQQHWPQTTATTFNQQHHDLSQQQQLQQQQSSASSAGSQHSATTNMTSVSTSRHYLFASPSAVNAYKTTITSSHQPIHYHHQQ